MADKAITKQILEAAKFEEQGFGRWAIPMPDGRNFLIFDINSQAVHFAGAPIITVESEEHLREVLEAFRIRPQ